eukprot:TRINITY_DN65592_c0_g1_i1.p1 TRINITY_DN65592_c0_g1~~TRINITY_DN65592_c0_g1_i1.p1  ORF type:complete len:383 (+),score=30.69 TRINITY_DN65592_c0_g1_i1:64-1149(+)
MGNCLPDQFVAPSNQATLKPERKKVQKSAPTKARLSAEVKHEKMQKQMRAHTLGRAPPFLAPYLQAAAPVAFGFLHFLKLLSPYVISCIQLCVRVYSALPTNIISALIGLALCFFGGLFPTLIAACEAARVCGWDRTVASFHDLAAEAEVAIEASEKDDADGASALKGKELVAHKTKLILAKCNAERVNEGIGGLMTSWLAIEAVLQTEYAKTITLALSIGDMIRKPLLAIVAPPLLFLTPEVYRQWVPVVLGWVAKASGMWVAWYIQRVLSAVHSGLRGGLLFARSMLSFLHSQGWRLWGLIPADPDCTIIDEIGGWSLAAAGIYWQFSHNFHAPFPLDILLSPLTIGEYVLEWHITRKA